MDVKASYNYMVSSRPARVTQDPALKIMQKEGKAAVFPAYPP